MIKRASCIQVPRCYIALWFFYEWRRGISVWLKMLYHCIGSRCEQKNKVNARNCSCKSAHNIIIQIKLSQTISFTPYNLIVSLLWFKARLFFPMCNQIIDNAQLSQVSKKISLTNRLKSGITACNEQQSKTLQSFHYTRPSPDSSRRRNEYCKCFNFILWIKTTHCYQHFISISTSCF